MPYSLLIWCALALQPLQQPTARLQAPPQPAAERTIVIGTHLAADAHLHVGDRVVISATPGGAGDTVRVSAIVRRTADPSELARKGYHVRVHLGQLQRLIGYGDRVDRFAVATRDSAATRRALAAINQAAFGFHAYRSKDIAAETSETFRVVSRFHRAIGVITIVASAVFLLCILLLKVDERRRDVAALRLLGLSRASVVRSVVIEAAFVSVLGSLLGVGLGIATSFIVNTYYQGFYRTPLRFSIVTPGIVLFAVVLSLVLGIGAGLLAANRLVRTPPLSLLGR
ncbi:MAG TPA: FtsX-like permease family protein [Gemmatimonadaceae bacterium]|nr:FtsX-like permease family protein [Gemmatimonadaceae bacterium]